MFAIFKDKKIKIYLLAAVLIAVTFILLGFSKMRDTEQKIKIFDPWKKDFRDLDDYILNAEPDEETKKNLLGYEPKVEEDFVAPDFNFMPPRFNEILGVLKPGRMKRAEVIEELGEFGAPDAYDVLDPEEPNVSIGHFFLEYNESDELTRAYYINLNAEDFSLEEVLKALGKPEFIFLESPSDPNHLEYIYASKGLTFFLNTEDKPVYVVVKYKPQTLNDYRKNYRKTEPFFYEK